MRLTIPLAFVFSTQFVLAQNSNDGASQYLFADEKIKDYLFATDHVVIGQIFLDSEDGSIDDGGRNARLISRVYRISVLESLKGGLAIGNSIRVRIEDDYIEFQDSGFALKEFSVMTAERRDKELRRMLDIYNGFEEMFAEGVLDKEELDEIARAFELQYQRSLGNTEMVITELNSNRSNVPGRNVVIGIGDVGLFLLSSPDEAFSGLMKLYPSSEFGIYQGMEMQYIRILIENFGWE